MNYDVVTLGETMVRLTPPGFLRFEQAPTLEVHIGGSESNTSVGLARLGFRVTWLSRLTSNPFGQFIASSLAAHGVDVSHVVWTDEDRVGTFFLERGKPPRGSRVLYDRKLSAASRMRPEHLPTGLFVPGRAKVFHTSGITLGISPEAAKTAWQAAELAREAGWQVSFDLNYRAKLWSPAEARAVCHAMMRTADYAFLPRRDARTLYGVTADDASEALKRLAENFPGRTIVLTLGAEGAAAINASHEIFLQPAFPAEEVERLGGGDAFSAGFLAGLLNSNSLPDALRWGAAAAALKYTIPGELPLIRRSEIEQLIGSSSGQAVMR